MNIVNSYMEHGLGDLRQVIYCSTHGCSDKMKDYTFLRQKLERLTHHLDIQLSTDPRIRSRIAKGKPKFSWELMLIDRRRINMQIRRETNN